MLDGEGDEAGRGALGFYGSFELAAGGVDVAASGAADVGGDAAGDEGLLEDLDGFGCGLGVGDAGAWVPNDEVDFGVEGFGGGLTWGARLAW